MPQSAKHLVIGSTEAYSGKSATILGIGNHLKASGLDIAYGKPLGTCLSESDADDIDEDVRFVARTLKLPENHLLPTILSLDGESIARRIAGNDSVDYQHSLEHYLNLQGNDLALLEGPGTLDEGTLFDLSLGHIAKTLDAPVLLVARFHSVLTVDALLCAKQRLGHHLIGAVINDIPPDRWDDAHAIMRPFLEQQDIPIFSLLPRSDLLRSVSVGELVNQLEAEVICCSNRLDLLVESLKIGAMNVNSALKYFRKARNMAVVTGGDRTDIQLAALETSTHCLILTGHIGPSTTVLNRAEDLEIPILSVDLDTLTTVEIVDRTFGQVRLHEPMKLECIYEMMSEHFNFDRLMNLLKLELPVAAP
ncbi:MAG: phosphotransacetylase family protein [Elainellaceae cyanobacterium]